MTHDLEGRVASESEVARDLGFDSVEQFRMFHEHIDNVQKIVGPKLERIFGDSQGSQWCFEISSAVTEYFLRAFRK